MKFCSLFFLLAGTVAQRVIYQHTSTCAVLGSTVTLPCSFTPRSKIHAGETTIQLKVVRVVWCKNHTICHLTTPSVYDSNKTEQNPKFKYLGDMKSNCTLQIRNLQKQDEGTFRFRMEMDDIKGHFTNVTGANVTVEDGPQMKINSSETKPVLRRGDSVRLNCTTSCTFHQLEVRWSRNGQALQWTGPSLHLSPLTPEDSGNYTCTLGTGNSKMSRPYSLKVEEQEGSFEALNLVLIIGMSGVILVAFLLGTFIIFKRKRAATVGGTKGEQGDTEHKEQETNEGGDDVQYSSIHIKPKTQNRQREEESVIYSSVVRG